MHSEKHCRKSGVMLSQEINFIVLLRKSETINNYQKIAVFIKSYLSEAWRVFYWLQLFSLVILLTNCLLFPLSMQWLETAEMYIVTLLKYYLGQVQKSGMLCSLYIAVNYNELPLWTWLFERRDEINSTLVPETKNFCKYCACRA